MEICYLIPGIGLSDAERGRRERILNRISAPGTTVRVRGVRNGPRGIESAVDEYQALPEVLVFVMNHQNEYDAFIIGCAGDTGLEGCREQSGKPIIGPGESSILLGTVGDRRFSMVTISNERARIKRRLVREAGIDAHRLASSHALGIHVLNLYDDPLATQAALIDAMREAKSAGAETMLLGCMSVAFMEPKLLREASHESGLPLVNPVVTAVKMAEALVAMDRYGIE
jgi:allantoin racemase